MAFLLKPNKEIAANTAHWFIYQQGGYESQIFSYGKLENIEIVCFYNSNLCLCLLAWRNLSFEFVNPLV